MERHIDGDDQKNAILAPFDDCHDPDRSVSMEPNIHSGSFNNAEKFFIDVSFNMFYSTAKVDKKKLVGFLALDGLVVGLE